MGLWSFYLYGKRIGDPIHGSGIQFFLLFMFPWDGEHGTGEFCCRNTGIYLGDTIDFRKRYYGAAYRSSGLRRDKTHRKSSGVPSSAGIGDLYFIFPAGTFIMRRPHTRCIFKDFPVCIWDPADFRRDRRFWHQQKSALWYIQRCVFQ